MHAILTRSAVLQALPERGRVDGQNEDFGEAWIELALVVGTAREKHIRAWSEDGVQSVGVPQTQLFVRETRSRGTLRRRGIAKQPCNRLSQRSWPSLSSRKVPKYVLSLLAFDVQHLVNSTEELQEK